MTFSPIRYISFDCYGTLTDFEIGPCTRALFEARISSDAMPSFLEDFTTYRYDEVLGDWKPYPDVIGGALERCCRQWKLHFDAADVATIVSAIPSWGPHADVPGPLATLADHYPLVILSNASDNQIMANVEKLGAPFHAVLTAEQAQAYKPRFAAFEYMFESLNARPEQFLHVSSSLRYDLMSAHDLRMGKRVLIERGHGPANPEYGYETVADLSGLPTLLSLDL